MFNYNCPVKKKGVTCEYCDSKGNVWGNFKTDTEKVFCKSNPEIECTPSEYSRQITGSKMTKSQIKQDRQKRSTNNFKDTVYGGLSGGERKYFSEKKGFKN